MKVAVMGAGAVGCYYGAMLARAGHDVMLVGRPSHVETIRRNGLRLEAQTFDEFVPLSASTDVQAVAGAELVMFCVKSTDTDSAALAMKPYLHVDALVISLQNGVENAERLRTLLPQTVAAAVVYVAAGMAGPGHIRHQGRGELILEPSRTSEAVAQAFIAAGVPTVVSDNVRGALWSKLIINCAYNALSAITQLSYGELVKEEGIPAVIQAVIAECVAVASREGVTLSGDIDKAVALIIDTMPGQHSSTAQDVARRKSSEIDHLNGLIVRRGDALGIPVPSNRVLHALVKLMDARVANASPAPG